MAWKQDQKCTTTPNKAEFQGSMRQAKVKQGGIAKDGRTGKCDNAEFLKDAFDSFIKNNSNIIINWIELTAKLLS